LTNSIDAGPAPVTHATCGTGNGDGVTLGVAAGLDDSAGLVAGDSLGLAATTVGIAVACVALGDGEPVAASEPCEAPTAQPLPHRINSTSPASRPILEG